MKTLPNDLIVEILSWLPPNHLCSLRFVCKPWVQLLTTDTGFTKLQFDRSFQLKRNPSILACKQKLYNQEKPKFNLAIDHTECDDAVELDLPFFHHQASRLCIVYGICNGLVCLSQITHPHKHKNEVHIWNPLTREHITVLYSPPSETWKSTVLGFGFLESTNEYKLIKIVNETDLEKNIICKISVYTLGKDSSWRSVAESTHISVNFSYGLHISGVVHWLTYEDERDIIVAFNLRDESFHKMAAQNDFAFDDNFNFSWIGELDGLLCIINATHGEDIQIWTMKEYGVASSWTKQLKIGRPGEIYYLKPLGVVAHSGDIILEKNIKELIIHNCKTNSTGYLKEFGSLFRCAHAFYGSVISPRGISGAAHTMASTVPS